MTLMRLQKFLSAAGVCSRRKAEELNRAGRVRVIGQVVVALGVKTDPQTDQISVDGQTVRPAERMIYIALNTSPGQEVVLTILRDGEYQDITVTLEPRPAE